jgi:D-alanyl-lipoteichoic acid acyltransferase DltB (MBOAT superfamily)
MLFNSPVFLVGFLPICLAGFYAFGIAGRYRLALSWLTVMSLVFYAWWSIACLPLLLASIVFNFFVGRKLTQTSSKPLLIFGIGANILVLGLFKYTGFIGQTISVALGLGWHIPEIPLPLAISFFTFQQIAYLADSYDGLIDETHPLQYCLFITFFPHLIAGPITHHREMLPQFNDRGILRPRLDLLTLGATVFLVGLFKKVVIADGIAAYAKPVFAAAAQGMSLSFLEAWGGALAYAMQIYFDFSGYSDMALGLALLFGVRLPLNFASPYKASGIIDYWQTWHMTLTRFLTSYVFNPVVMSLTRKRMASGKPLLRPGRTDLSTFLVLLAGPTMLTMLVSGIWHGAGWQFVIFGLLHGVFLSINHGWRNVKARLAWWPKQAFAPLRRGVGVLTTFVCATLALVFFRSEDVPSALRVVGGMIGNNGFAFPDYLRNFGFLRVISDKFGIPIHDLPFFSIHQLYWLPILFGIVWLLPNVEQWMRHYQTALNAKLRAIWYEDGFLGGTFVAVWRPTMACACVVSAIGLLALLKAFSHAPTEFLYFKF